MSIFGVFLGLLLSFAVTTFGGTQAKAADTERQVDIVSLRAQIEASFSAESMYPTLAQMNDASWRGQHLQSLDGESLKDPSGSSEKLVTKPAKNSYSYTVTGDGGKGCDDIKVPCTAYTLTATLSTGKTYTLQSLD